VGIGNFGGQPPIDPRKRYESKKDVERARPIIISLIVVVGLAVVSFLLWLAQGS